MKIFDEFGNYVGNIVPEGSDYSWAFLLAPFMVIGFVIAMILSGNGNMIIGTIIVCVLVAPVAGATGVVLVSPLVLPGLIVGAIRKTNDKSEKRRLVLIVVSQVLMTIGVGILGLIDYRPAVIAQYYYVIATPIFLFFLLINLLKS